MCVGGSEQNDSNRSDVSCNVENISYCIETRQEYNYFWLGARKRCVYESVREKQMEAVEQTAEERERHISRQETEMQTLSPMNTQKAPKRKETVTL